MIVKGYKVNITIFNNTFKLIPKKNIGTINVNVFHPEPKSK